MITDNIKITGVAGTVSKLTGVNSPENAEKETSAIVEKATSCLGIGELFDRVLIYNPDAVAWWLYEKYSELFAPVVKNTDMQLKMQSVMPSVTPVCFASMYCGVEPQIHGILKYEKPVLQIDTLFDEMIKSGKKCAIVSETKASMSMIFLNRAMDYYIYDTIDEVNEKAVELIKADEYDFLAVYNGNFDSTMHKFGPESTEALEVLKRNCEDFEKMVNIARKEWTDHNVFYGFCTDHGCHEIDGDCGSHGLDMDEDMQIFHAYGWCIK